MATQIIYETHATTTDNERGIATGWLPGELSEAGRQQARMLAQRRQGDDLAAIFVSDLARAIQTAEIAFGGSDIPVHRDARLRECNYGALNGMPLARLHAERRCHIHQPWPSGQSYMEVVDQTRSLLLDLVATWDGHTVLIIAHSANRWALDHLLCRVPLEELVDAPFSWQAGWNYTLASG